MSHLIQHINIDADESLQLCDDNACRHIDALILIRLKLGKNLFGFQFGKNPNSAKTWQKKHEEKHILRQTEEISKIALKKYNHQDGWQLLLMSHPTLDCT